MSNDVIKNPLRNNHPQVQKYVPEYVRLNKRPVQMQQAFENDEDINEPIRPPGVYSLPTSLLKRNPDVNQATFDSFDNQMFGPNDQVAPSKGPYKAEVIDDFSEDQMYEDPSFAPTITNHNTSFNDEYPNIGQYILMVQGKVILSGDLNKIEVAAQKILYGEDPKYQKNLNLDDLVILKRVGLKVGVFVQE